MIIFMIIPRKFHKNMRNVSRINPADIFWQQSLSLVSTFLYTPIADPSESTHLAPQTIKVRDRDHQAEVNTTANSTAFATPISQLDDEEQALTISRTPRAGRYERQVEEDQVDRCRLFVEGDPTKNELYSPEYPNLYPKNINCTRVITGESHILNTCFMLYVICSAQFENSINSRKKIPIEKHL